MSVMRIVGKKNPLFRPLHNVIKSAAQFLTRDKEFLSLSLMRSAPLCNYTQNPKVIRSLAEVYWEESGDFLWNTVFLSQVQTMINMKEAMQKGLSSLLLVFLFG